MKSNNNAGYATPVVSNNKIIIKMNDKQTYNIKINPPVELDYLTRDQIFKLRKGIAAKYPGIIAPGYSPSMEIYGQITDKKPWWGQIGLNCKANPRQSIEGLSEESRFLDNPLLLLGLDRSNAFDFPKWNCKGFYPEVIKLYYQPKMMTITAVYNMTKYFNELKNSPIGAQIFSYELKGENARDFGYNYAYVYNAQNISFINGTNLGTDVQQIRNFIHTGGSCQYPGGCNNGSPYQPDFEFGINKLPALLNIKLWKQKPKSKDDAADFYFDIKLQ